MLSQSRSLLVQARLPWNWKCAVLSATARSLMYLAAMTRAGSHGRLAVVLVEIVYVLLTAGVYAGMQQRALEIRSRWLGNLIVVLGVPGLAQLLDWAAHCITGAAATGRVTLGISLFAALSALFHLHVMRGGVFLTGNGRSLLDDFRRVPRLVVGFVGRPVVFFAALSSRANRAIEPEATL